MKGIEGSTLGRYELRRLIARGGMSEVYLGYDRRVRRSVAVKVLYGSDEPFVRRFEREALAVGTLSHDHILPLYDFGEQRPWYYLVMPYIDGGTLRDYLLRRERLTLEEAGYFLEQIASALQCAHDHGVVHRDVKPSNILLRTDGYAYLVDFGLAKAKMATDSLGNAGTMIGTPEYMAPEQSNGISDYRSDIYSLGIILYQMLTGNVPFMADSPVAISLKHIQSAPIPPSQVNDSIPTAIEEVVLKALDKDPEQRYQQARAFAAAYKQALYQTLSHESQTPADPQQATHTDNPTGATVETATQVANLQPPIFILPMTTVPHSPPEIFSKPRPIGKRRNVFTVLMIGLGLLLIGSSIAFGLLWQPPKNIAWRNQSHPANTAATASAEASAQAALAAQARVQATAGITTDINVGTRLFADVLTTPHGGWINDSYQCYFSPTGYHVYTNLTHGLVWCYYNQRWFSNVAITVQGVLQHGDLYGLIFRLSPSNKAFYALELNNAGEYRLIRAQGSNPQHWLTLVDWTPSGAIQKGYGHINTFLVISTGSHFRVYMNKQLIIPEISDTAYASGMIGFLVGSDNKGSSEATFTNLWVFQK